MLRRYFIYVTMRISYNSRALENARSTCLLSASGEIVSSVNDACLDSFLVVPKRNCSVQTRGGYTFAIRAKRLFK